MEGRNVGPPCVPRVTRALEKRLRFLGSLECLQDHMLTLHRDRQGWAKLHVHRCKLQAQAPNSECNDVFICPTSGPDSKVLAVLLGIPSMQPGQKLPTPPALDLGWEASGWMGPSDGNEVTFLLSCSLHPARGILEWRHRTWLGEQRCSQLWSLVCKGNPGIDLLKQMLNYPPHLL